MKNWIAFLAALSFLTSVSSQNIHHEVKADIDIKSSTLSVINSMTVPAKLITESGSLVFCLNSNLKIAPLGESFELKVLKTEEEGAIYSKYSITCKATDGKAVTIPFKYSGQIKEDIETGGAEYARGFSETSGIIAEKGVYMAGSTYWLPRVEDELVSFNMSVTIDTAWSVVSQGKRTGNEVDGGKRTIRYESPEIMDDVYLIAARFTEYNKKVGTIDVQAFLRTPDEPLATRYLEATGGFLEMYEKLIGPYPYTKFALVENFWETGYGMPSFTLLGEKVIRFPWLLYSSYPHELLHNWWGNSVYVNYEQGNWCEGLTAYMADHLLKEQRGKGADYRRGALQKFADHVNDENDMPVKDFRSRNNAAQEAIGYGKVMMMNEMLRTMLGDEVFIKTYSDFNKNNQFRNASFDDIRQSFEKESGKDLKWFFDQWILRKGAPAIELSGVTVKPNAGEFDLSFNLSQIQKDEPFNLLVPVAVYLEGKDEVQMETINLTEVKKACAFKYSQRPLRVDIDPQFNVFRKLNRAEVPLALSQVFGNRDAVLVLPGKSAHLAAYKTLADTWKQSQEAQGKKLEVVLDSELDALPADKSVWVIGFENKFAEEMKLPDAYKTYMPKQTLEQFSRLEKEGSLVYVLANSKNESITNGFVATTNGKAVAGLTRKLSHYGKYGYLGFTGDEPTNVAKGALPILDSPLTYYIKYEGGSPAIKAKLTPRKALGQ